MPATTVGVPATTIRMPAAAIRMPAMAIRMLTATIRMLATAIRMRPVSVHRSMTAVSRLAPAVRAALRPFFLRALAMAVGALGPGGPRMADLSAQRSTRKEDQGQHQGSHGDLSSISSGGLSIVQHQPWRIIHPGPVGISRRQKCRVFSASRRSENEAETTPSSPKRQPSAAEHHRAAPR